MSECVVRMEMPRGCGYCRIAQFGYCGITHEPVADAYMGYPENRPKNCPIICSLPEGHGRLVDAELVKEILKPVDSISHYEPEWTWSELHEINCVAIDNAPTIVPATNTPTNTPTATERSET